MTLEISDISFCYGSRQVLDHVGFNTGAGITAILGPNGAGKSTFVKCISGSLTPSFGSASFDGLDLLDRGGRVAAGLSYMSQDTQASTSMTVLDVMILGLAETLSLRVTEDDVDRAYRPLEELHLEEFAEMPLNSLSGGQRQMVMIAQCLVSDPKLMILDEPMNNLDLRRELEMFDVLRRVTDERGMTSLMVLHDINFASRFSDSMVVMKDGKTYSQGLPADVVTEDMIREVYGVEAFVDSDRYGRPRIDPIRSVR